MRSGRELMIAVWGFEPSDLSREATRSCPVAAWGSSHKQRACSETVLMKPWYLLGFFKTLKDVFGGEADGACRIQVGNWTADKGYWGRVEDIKYKQATYSTAVADGASDLGGQVCFRRSERASLSWCPTPPPPVNHADCNGKLQYGATPIR